MLKLTYSPLFGTLFKVFKPESMTFHIKNEADIIKKLGQVVYVAGTQWGDEGKGKLVDIFSEQYDVIARCAGGANAGHTICVSEKGKSRKFIFHLLPSGVLHKNKVCVIGNGTVIHIPTLLDEIEALKKEGIDLHGRLFISDRAHLIFDYHKEIDVIQEKVKGETKVGTTKRGIGPAYTDKVSRIGIRVADLADLNGFAEKFRRNAERHMKCYGFDFDIEEAINYHNDTADLILQYAADTTELLHQYHTAGKNILIEGAQGAHLDIDHGTYPYVTSSSTVSGGASTGLGFPPNKIDNIIGIVKAYTTRVGAGPLPTELGGMEGNMLREQGAEYGSTTGRPRRCGWLDLTAVRNAVGINGVTSINLTKLDVLSGLKTLKIGTGYKLDGTPIASIPASLDDFAHVEVDTVDMEGWQEDISKTEHFSDLPKNCQMYIKKIEELVGVPVNFIGVGVHRNEMIYR